MNGCSNIRITDSAVDDLMIGFGFYDSQLEGLGAYFLESLSADIDALSISAGVHFQHLGTYRSLASRFPYAIYYLLENNTAIVFAVLETRRDPLWTRQQLSSRQL